MNLWVLSGQGVALSLQETFDDLKAGKEIKQDKLLWGQEQAALLKSISGCRTDWAGQISSISLRLHEMERLQADQGDESNYLQQARQNVENALACGPYQANLWLLLAKIEFHQAGPSPKAVEYLRQNSYLAPHEGKEILERMAFSARIYPFLPDDMQRALKRDIQLAERSELPALQSAAKTAHANIAHYQ